MISFHIVKVSVISVRTQWGQNIWLETSRRKASPIRFWSFQGSSFQALKQLHIRVLVSSQITAGRRQPRGQRMTKHNCCFHGMQSGLKVVIRGKGTSMQCFPNCYLDCGSRPLSDFSFIMNPLPKKSFEFLKIIIKDLQVKCILSPYQQKYTLNRKFSPTYQRSWFSRGFQTTNIQSPLPHQHYPRLPKVIWNHPQARWEI